MTFEKLNDNVMLVELSSDEMRKYRITYDCLEENNESSQQAIRNIIKSIDNEKNYEKVVVEALPIEKGGCFFIFTFTPSVKRKYKIRKSEDRTVFSIANINNLLDFMSYAKKTIRKDIVFTVYKMDEGFFISVPSCNQRLNIMLSEFGNLTGKFTRDRICEYGKKLGDFYLQ